VCSIGFHGAPIIDRVVFVDSKILIAQWADRLFRIDVDRASAIQLPETPGQKRIDPSGNVLAVQNHGSTRLYTLPGLRQTGSLDKPSSTLLRIANHGGLLAFEASEVSNAIDVWDVAANARVCRVVPPAELTSLALHPAGTVLFTAESENLQAWDIPSGKRRFSLTASDEIGLIIPDPSSAAFATVTHGRLTVWSAVTGVRLAQLPDAGYIRAAAFSPDGRYLLTGYNEHSAAVWLWRSSDLRDQACSRLTSNLSHAEWARWFLGESYRRICANLPEAK
jgi:WD40 repeat protein